MASWGITTVSGIECMRSPVAVSHTSTGPFTPPAASRVPSGDQDRFSTRRFVPLRTCMANSLASQVNVPHDDLALVAPGRRERAVRAESHAEGLLELPVEGDHRLPGCGVHELDWPRLPA